MDHEAQQLETFLPACVDPGFGLGFLEAYRKQGAALSDVDWARYTLEADLKLNGSNYGQRFKHKYFDATFNFCLAHDGALAASLGFEIDDAAMNVWQIQGVKGKERTLRPVKWERALVQYGVAWARDVGLSEVFIVSVDHHAWAGRTHLDPARGKLRYDVTAKRCGFRHTGDGYYRLAIKR